MVVLGLVICFVCLEVALLEEGASQSVPPPKRVACRDLEGEAVALLVGGWADLVEGEVVGATCTAGRAS